MAEAFTNWSGSLACTPRDRVRATSGDEVAATLRRAAADGLTVRPVGSGHSSMPLVTTGDVMLSVDDMRGVTSVDREAGLPRVLLGTGLAPGGRRYVRGMVTTSEIADNAQRMVNDSGGFPAQEQEPPGLTSRMDPLPDHGEHSYRGSGRLEGLRALITGGDSGIGRAAAIAFAREGADVALSYLRSEQSDAEDTAGWIEKAGRRAVLLPPEALEGLGDCDLHVLLRQAWAGGQGADLGGDHHVGAVAARSHPLAEDPLGLAIGVAVGPYGVEVGGVDEVAAGGDERVEHRERRLAVRGPAEGVAAQVEGEDVDVGARDAGHGALLCW